MGMERIQIEIDEQTLASARRLAATRRCSVEALIAEMIVELAASRPAEDRLLGMFADEPELLDRAVESVMLARERHPLRHTGG